MRGERIEVLHRVKGRPVLIRSARSLVLRVHRYGRARARTAAEIRWTARALDALDVALRVMEQPDEAAARSATHAPPPSSEWGDVTGATTPASSVHPAGAGAAGEGSN